MLLEEKYEQSPPDISVTEDTVMNWEIGGTRPLRREISVEINEFPIKPQFAKTPISIFTKGGFGSG